jgi:hypothetical protein
MGQRIIWIRAVKLFDRGTSGMIGRQAIAPLSFLAGLLLDRSVRHIRRDQRSGANQNSEPQGSMTERESVRSELKRQPSTSTRHSPPLDVLLGALAPVTLVTGLLIYLGYATNRAYFSYFGISQGMLSLSMESYVLGSADVTFGSSIRLVAVAAALTILEWCVAKLQERWQRAGRALAQTIRIAATAAILSGLYYAFGGPVPQGVSPIAFPIALAGGATLLFRQHVTKRSSLDAATAAAERPSVGRRRLPQGALLAFVVLAAFWAVHLHAVEAGRAAAKIDDTTPGGLPLTTVFSKEPLDLPGSRIENAEIALPGQR